MVVNWDYREKRIERGKLSNQGPGGDDIHHHLDAVPPVLPSPLDTLKVF